MMKNRVIYKISKLTHRLFGAIMIKIINNPRTVLLSHVSNTTVIHCISVHEFIVFYHLPSWDIKYIDSDWDSSFWKMGLAKRRQFFFTQNAKIQQMYKSILHKLTTQISGFHIQNFLKKLQRLKYLPRWPKFNMHITLSSITPHTKFQAFI